MNSIVIVDDSPGITKTARSACESESGFNVYEEAFDGQDAGHTPTASLVLSILAFVISAVLALDRLRGKRSDVAGVASRHREAI